MRQFFLPEYLFIINRMSGRRACVDCGATYHIVYASTKQEGICDNCGGSLILRDDDKPESLPQGLLQAHPEQGAPGPYMSLLFCLIRDDQTD